MNSTLRRTLPLLLMLLFIVSVSHAGDSFILQDSGSGMTNIFGSDGTMGTLQTTPDGQGSMYSDSTGRSGYGQRQPDGSMFWSFTDPPSRSSRQLKPVQPSRPAPPSLFIPSTQGRPGAER